MLIKKNFLVVTILILLVFLVTGCNLFPKPTKGIISGRVLMPPSGKELSRDVSGWVPAANATVTIMDASGVTHTVITDANGYYTFENIAVKANTVVTAKVKVDGKTMVLKTVIDKAVKEDGEYDSGKMTPESTALALVVEKLIKEGVKRENIDLKEIEKSDSFDDLVEQVETVLEDHGNVTDDDDVEGLIDEVKDEVTTTTTALTSINISGQRIVGETLTASILPVGATVTYQWMISSTSAGTYTNITGATQSTYTLANTTAGKYIKVKATGTGNYTGTVTSAALGPVVKIIKGIEVKARDGATNSDKITVGNVTGSDGDFAVTVTGDDVLTPVEGSNATPHKGKWFGLQLVPVDVNDITVLEYKTSIHTTNWSAFTQDDVIEAGKPGEIVWWIDGDEDGPHSIWLKYKDEADRTAIKLTVKFKYKEEVLEEVLAELNNLFTGNTYNGMNNVQVADEYRGRLITLGLPAGENTRYDALDERGTGGSQRHSAVFVDLWSNMPGGGYDLDTLIQYFNEIVETRHATKDSVALVDAAVEYYKDNNEEVPENFDLKFVEILNTQFTSVQYTYHSRARIEGMIRVLGDILEAWESCEKPDEILSNFLSNISTDRSQNTIISIGKLLEVNDVEEYKRIAEGL